MAQPPPSIEDDAGDDHCAPENGGPDSDCLAKEAGDEDRQQESGIGAG